MKVNKSVFTKVSKGIIFLTGILFLLPACVGTVEDKNPPTTKGAQVNNKVSQFEGIVGAYPISHSKVEILFNPAIGLAFNLTYVITYDGLNIPFTFPGETLSPDYRGHLKVIIGGLSINTNYNFQVQVIDDLSGLSSLSDKSILVKTYSNIASNFWGITNTSNLSGVDGRNAISVNWAAAERQGSDFVKKEIDPINYEIILLDSDQLSPASFDDETQPAAKRKVVLVDGAKISHQVNGLQAGTKYYVRVQCIHHGYSLYGADPTYLRDSNSKYLEIETLGDNSSDIEVDLNLFTVTTAQGIAGLSSFNILWDIAQGAFDHYRIYYKPKAEGPAWSTYKTSKDDICDGQESNAGNPPTWFCKKINFANSTSTITDLIPFTEYDIQVVICLNNTCNSIPGVNFLEYVSAGPYETDPGTAVFSGIKDPILQPLYFWALGEIYLEFTPPDLNTGVADGLLVKVNERLMSPDGPGANTYLNHPVDPNTTSLFIPPFDYVSDNVVIVRGVIPGSEEPYCFSLVPYVWKGGVVEPRLEDEIIRCISVKIESPLSSEYAGIDFFSFDSGINMVSL
jgi:hypothetical protein